mgnify:CR=1|jgi:hypothetical protein|tara:strand:- start:3965 stop:4141 length:177 start_codon:yes stop_codon:yes gene_type:complete
MHRENEKRLLITSIHQELQIRIDWLEKGLMEIVKSKNKNDVKKEMICNTAKYYLSNEN